MATQGFPGSKHDQTTLSGQSSGIDPADYEVAAQLISHSQGRRDSGEGHNGDADLNRRDPIDGISGLHEDTGDGTGEQNGHEHARRSSSQDRLEESQYSPLKVSPSNGQRCR